MEMINLCIISYNIKMKNVLIGNMIFRKLFLKFDVNIV